MKKAIEIKALDDDETLAALKMPKFGLQYRENCAHGNPYFRLRRNEVESLARELHGAKGAIEIKQKGSY